MNNKNKNNIIVKIEKEAKKYFIGAKGSHDFEHTQRVYNLAMHIGRKEKANMEILKVAVILHDIKRKEEDDKLGGICHAELGAREAGKILEKYDLPKNFSRNVLHSIHCHRFRDNNIPQTLEAEVLYDADKLDSIGAAGIGRAFLFAGEIGAKLHNPDVDIDNTEQYSKDDTAYREYLFKLSKIKNKIITQEGKRIAKERHKFMVEFFERLNKEVEGVL